jgi:hypothetical protein
MRIVGFILAVLTTFLGVANIYAFITLGYHPANLIVGVLDIVLAGVLFFCVLDD